jgi:hypothetical protein
VVPATAEQPVWLDDDVSQLASGTKTPDEKPAIFHNRTTNTCAHGEHDHGVGMLGSTELEFRPAGGVGIIFQGHWPTKALLEDILKREVRPCNVGSKVDTVSGAIQEAGSGDPNGRRYVISVQLGHHRNDGVDNRLWIRGISGPLNPL